MPQPPSGTVSFLFTDLEGSTRLWEEQPDAMRSALGVHDELLRQAIEAHGGYVFSTAGDAFAAAFGRAADAVGAAVDGQRALQSERWPGGIFLRVRMGIHTGEAVERDGDYFGPTLNRAARLMAIGHGGQVLVSSTTAAVLGNTDGLLKDLGDHRLRDLSRPERVHQLVADGLIDDFPALRGLDTLPTNLPSQLTSFVGRDDELARLRKAAAEHRLVTLSGVGGVGKTRLALQVAADLAAEFRDGAWLCELAPAADPEAMAAVVATAFSVQPRAGMTLEDSVVEALRGRDVLWVLDNCEHLVDAAARLVDRVLRAAPGVRVIATSREALDVEGEHILPLRSMATSSSDDPVAIGDSDAVQLFVDRASALRPEFDVDAANARTINEICRRVDGIPLAIELAASRMASMGVAEILSLLDERFRLLTGGRRASLERHQTLRATVDWSYAALTTAEQKVFDRLSVFAGSFDARAARAVVTGDEIDEWAVLDALGGLVRKSMLSVDEQPDGSVRYQLLETLRQYARERLDGEGDTDLWRRRHADYYVAVTEVIGEELMTAHEFAARARLFDEIDNIRAASLWALDSGEIRGVLKIVMALEAERIAGTAPMGNVATRALEQMDALTAAERQELVAAATIEAYRGDMHRLAELVEEVYQLQPDPSSWTSRVMRTQVTPGMASVAQMRRVAAVAHTWDPVAGERSGADAAEWSRRLVNVALAAINTGDVETARRYSIGAMALAQRSGSPSTLAQGAMQLGMALASVAPDDARRSFQECIDLGRRGVKFMGRGGALMQAALIDAERGDRASAGALLAEAIAVMRPAGRSSELDGACGYAVEIFERLGGTEAALVMIGAITDGRLRVLREMPMPPSRHAPDLRAMRETVGEQRFAQLLAAGARMTYEEILDHILEALQALAGPT